MIRLKQLRKDKGLTQREMANLSNLSLPTYNRYEKGDILPNIKDVENMAKIFDVNPAYIVGWSDDYEKTPRQIKDIDLTKIENWKARFLKDFDFLAAKYSTIIRNVYTKIPYHIPLNSIDNSNIYRLQPQVSISDFQIKKDQDIFAFVYDQYNMQPIITEGTILICRAKEVLHDNDFVVVHINHNDAVIKQYKIFGTEEYLTEPNPFDKPIRLNGEYEIEIVGVVLQAINYLKPTHIL